MEDALKVTFKKKQYMKHPYLMLEGCYYNQTDSRLTNNSHYSVKKSTFQQEFHQPERKGQDQTISLTEN
jgi:hypothetical protein